MNKPLKILFQSRSTLFSVPGGDTTQILKTKEHLEGLGLTVDISLDLRPNLDKYDIVHVFNLMRPQDLFLQVKNAKSQGKIIALSTIYGPYTEFEKKARAGVLKVLNQKLTITQIEYLKVLARSILNREFSMGTLIYLLRGHRNLQHRILKMTDIFLPNSESEMRRIEKDFSTEDLNYVTVPNAVDIARFNLEEVSVEPGLKQFENCVLCVSRIEGRKNQLNIVRALKDLECKVLFIGQPSANFKNYYDLCLYEANERMVFTGSIKHEDLPKYYRVAKVHILASWMETPGLSSIEAGVMGCNIVVTRKGDAEDYFKDLAYYCEPDDLVSIRYAVTKALEDEVNHDLRRLILKKYNWQEAAEATLRGYNMAMKERENNIDKKAKSTQ